MELWAIYPELLIAGAGLVLVPVAGWATGRWREIPSLLALAVFVAAIVLTARMLPWAATPIFGETYVVDRFGTVFKLLLELGGLITVCLLHGYFRDREALAHAPVAVLFSTLGGMALVSALDLALIALFLQMVSLASYVLVALARGERLANEAAIKYFLYAATALAIMAYGMTFLFGLTGSLNLREIGRALPAADPVWIALAFGLVLIGYAFESTVAPFHFWAPDVYQGASAPVAGFLSVVPKIAALAALIRFLHLAFPHDLAAWSTVIAALSAVTMTFGNMVALRQTRLKRLLAYSGIVQAGYVLMAVVVLERIDGAWEAAGFYLAAYLCMNFGAFAVVAQLERGVGTDLITGLRGVGRSAPWIAAALVLSLLSLAGIPPLGGFTGKILLLEATLEGGYAWLAVIAAANMVIGLYYYVAIVAAVYWAGPRPGVRLAHGPGYAIPLALTVAGTLILGILPALFLELMA